MILKPEYRWVEEHAKAFYRVYRRPYIVPPHWFEASSEPLPLSVARAVRKAFDFSEEAKS